MAHIKYLIALAMVTALASGCQSQASNSTRTGHSGGGGSGGDQSSATDDASKESAWGSGPVNVVLSCDSLLQRSRQIAADPPLNEGDTHHNDPGSHTMPQDDSMSIKLGEYPGTQCSWADVHDLSRLAGVAVRPMPDAKWFADDKMTFWPEDTKKIEIPGTHRAAYVAMELGEVWAEQIDAYDGQMFVCLNIWTPLDSKTDNSDELIADVEDVFRAAHAAS
jgi:hypothetical protein